MLRMVRDLWKVSAKINVNNRIPLVLYQSKRSDLRVVIADVPGPMVKGMISFVTESDNNDGLPHTLEHLVFMGSERYPFKGVLDIIANCCLASGTNAFTDQDNTCYTLSTVGSNGFLKVLPVYLDHLLSPNLTKNQFITEVHHINGEGEDAGVVYSENQDYESDMDHIIDYKRKELLYPENCGYRVSTAGRLANLRTSCTNEKVQNYHKKYYHLSNLLISVCGIVNHDQLLAAIEPVEERELPKIPKNFKRPFQFSLEKIKEPKTAKVICPADDETNGVVEIAWFGPDVSDNYTISALTVLFDYLTDTAVAPLQKDFVQIADPYCSSVYIYLLEQTTCEIVVNFSGVSTSKLDEIKNRFFEKTVKDHMDLNNFDIERFGFVIDQLIKRFLKKLENNPSSIIFNACTGHQLYGHSIKELETRLNFIDTLKKLKMESANFWHGLFHKYFVKNCVCVMGEPSAKAVEEYTKIEEERLNKQIQQLGKDGLKNCEKVLKEAIKANTEKKPGAEVLENLIVKELENFNLFDIQTTSNLDKKNSFNSTFPFPVIHHNTPSDFIESPAVVDNQKLNFEDVSKYATRDLISNRISIGINGAYDRFISFRLLVDINGYKNLAKWTEIYLKNIIFDQARIAVCAKKLATAAAESKRDGSIVSAFLSTTFAYKPDANTNFMNYISLENFHKNIAVQVEKDEAKIIENLSKLRDHILKSPFNIHFACDSSKLKLDREENFKLWNFLSTDSTNLFSCSPKEGSNWSNSGISNVLTVGGTESSFLLQKIYFPFDWNGNSVMETLLLAQYITQCEGPLWNVVRGKGLAYGANIYVIPDRNSITLSLYRCSQLMQAYKQTKNIVTEILESKSLDNSQFEAAKRSLVCELISSQGSLKSASIYAMLATVRKIEKEFLQKLCKRIWYATIEDVLEKGAPYIEKLFDEKLLIRSIATNPSKTNEVKKCFPNAKFLELEKLQTLD